MAPVSVSAVLAVVGAVIPKLQAIAFQEVKLLWDVKEQVDKLVGDLQAMQAALIDINDKCYYHASGQAQQSFHVWVNQVREVTYETEDAVEEFMVHFSSPGNCCSHLNHLKHLKARHRLAYKIKKIRSTIKSISQRRNAFALVIPSSCSRCSDGGIDVIDPRSASLCIDEADIVGIDAIKEHMINMILGEDPRLGAAFVTGMGGLGKTTLLKKVFDRSLQTGNFKHHAWVTVSKSFNEIELLRATLEGFKEAANEPVDYASLQKMKNVQLVEALRSLLVDVKFILALDDMWTADAWEVIKHALPDSNCCSRILVTTRNDDIVAHFDTPACFVHKLQPLPEKDAWTLFCRKAFRGNDKGTCPKDLEDISLGILNKCDGLPLAIVAIGGVLSMKNKILSEWKHVFDSLSAELSKGGNLEGLWKILLLSYDELSYYLKICYLYIGAFPEDYLIKRSMILRLWVAERFVEEKAGLTMEEVAESYLNELVNRNMIQVVGKDDLFNRVKTFRVHDIMREIILSKSKEDALVEVLDDKNVTGKIKARRVAVHNSCEGLTKGNKGELWSLLLNTNPCADSLLDKKFFKGFIRLKVVNLPYAGLLEFPDQIVQLIHLRYLSLRGNRINTLPESIGKLKNLEILDLKHTMITSLPNGILKLKQLLYLRNYHCRFGMHLCSRLCGMEVPAGIGILTNLHNLGDIQALGEVGRATINEIGRLEKLRKLGLTGLSVNSGSDVCASLATLSNLRSLSISSFIPSVTLDLSSLSSPPQFLQDVLLRCGLDSLPNWISSLNYLSKLALRYSKLEQDPLAALQDLPSLVVLELEEAYNGKELCFGETGYLKLKHLRLHNLCNLESIKLLNGTMPVLSQMVLTKCEKLKMFQGIDNLKELKCVKTMDVPLDFCEMVFTGGLKMKVGPHYYRHPVERADGSSSSAN